MHRRPLAILLPLTLLSWYWTSATVGDVVYLAESREPIFGRLISADADHVVFQSMSENGKTSLKRIARAGVAKLIVTVDPQRLENLSPRRPRSYLEYAMELSACKRDAYAVTTARRLLTVGAFFGEEPDRASCLVALYHLEPSATARQRILALANSHFGARFQGLFSELPRPKIASLDRTPCLKLARAIRRNDFELAKSLGKTAFGSDVLDYRLPHDLTPDAIRLMIARESLTLAERLALTRWELELSPTDGFPVPNSPATWSDQQSQRPAVRLEWIDFDSLNEFDPNQCYFRHGRWQSTVP